DEGIALAARQGDENRHATRCVAPSQGDNHRAVAVYVVARREAEIRRAAEFVLVDLVALGNGPEHFAVAGLRRVPQLAGIGPDGHLELVEATHVVPVGVRDQHAAQPAAVVAAGVELLADGAGRLVGRAREPGLRLDVGRDAGPEARIDQEITPWVGNQDRRRGEGALIPERAALEREAGPGFVTAGRQLVDRHVRRWRGLREGSLPSGRHGQRLQSGTSLPRTVADVAIARDTLDGFHGLRS